MNYEYFDNQTPESAVALVDALRRGERPQPTRGAPLTDLRTVSLELAGILPTWSAASQGPSMAEETLRGARLATERGLDRARHARRNRPPWPDLPEKS